MIEEVGIENFKGIGKLLRLQLRPVTVLIGPNGSGKSTVLQALAALKQSVGQASLRLNGPQVALGQWEDIVHGGDTDLEILLGYGGKYTHRGQEDAYAHNIKFRSGQAVWAEARVGWMGHALEGEWPTEAESQVPRLTVGSSGKLTFPVQGVPGSPFGGVATTYNQADKERVIVISGQTEEFFQALRQQLLDLFFVPPFRGIASPDYSMIEQPETDLAPGRSSQELAMRLTSTLGYDRRLLRNVSEMLVDLFGHEVDFAPVPPMRASPKAVFEEFETPMVNDAAGANQLLGLFAQFALAGPGATVAVEEPEIHLHPGLQRDLVRLLVSRAAKEGKRLLLTTHSEHVVMAALSLLLKGELPRQDFALYQFSVVGGEVHAEETRISEDGTLEPGLEDFFEVNIEELSELLRALSGESD